MRGLLAIRGVTRSHPDAERPRLEMTRYSLARMKEETGVHNQAVHRLDHDAMEDPARWAMTWRAYKRKTQGDNAADQ